MIEIKCFKDIEAIKANDSIPEELVEMINEDLVIIKKWSDEDDEVSMDDFNAEDFGYGYIVILEGNETDEDIKELGLSDGLAGVVPEAAYSYFIKGTKWTRIVVVYNDSYTMSFWLSNSSQFNDYEVMCSGYSTTSGYENKENGEPF